MERKTADGGRSLQGMGGGGVFETWDERGTRRREGKKQKRKRGGREKSNSLGEQRRFWGDEGDTNSALSGRVQSIKGRARCWSLPGVMTHCLPPPHPPPGGSTSVGGAFSLRIKPSSVPRDALESELPHGMKVGRGRGSTGRTIAAAPPSQ